MLTNLSAGLFNSIKIFLSTQHITIIIHKLLESQIFLIKSNKQIGCRYQNMLLQKKYFKKIPEYISPLLRLKSIVRQSSYLREIIYKLGKTDQFLSLGLPSKPSLSATEYADSLLLNIFYHSISVCLTTLDWVYLKKLLFMSKELNISYTRNFLRFPVLKNVKI